MPWNIPEHQFFRIASIFLLQELCSQQSVVYHKTVNKSKPAQWHNLTKITKKETLHGIIRN